MLKGISPLLSPELLKVLDEMGHGDEIVFADANFPTVSTGKRIVRADGIGAVELLDAVLQDENICIRKAASGGAGQAAARCMDSELEFLQQLSRVTLVDLTGGEESLAFLPRWETEEVDFAAAYAGGKH